MNNREAMQKAFECQKFKVFSPFKCDISKNENCDYVEDETIFAFAWFCRGIASQAQQSQWISVDERLPEDNTYVLCSYKRFGEWLVHEGRYNEKGDFTITIIDAKVRYWMPLPPAPEGE